MKSVKSDEVVLPGDVVMDSLPTNQKLRLGPGLRIQQGAVQTTNLGILKQTSNRKLWIRSRQKMYVPAAGDSVVGMIQDRNSEFFIVDINSPWLAELPVTSFDNVTKRNIPPLKPGDLVFSTVTTALPFSNPTLSCTNNQSKATGMGILKGGFMTKISCSLARSLLSTPIAPVLLILGNQIQFEIVIGLNGVMWIQSEDPLHTILISQTIVQSETLTPNSVGELCEKTVLKLKEKV